jgi:hypothetical protein
MGSVHKWVAQQILAPESRLVRSFSCLSTGKGRAKSRQIRSPASVVIVVDQATSSCPALVAIYKKCNSRNHFKVLHLTDCSQNGKWLLKKDSIKSKKASGKLNARVWNEVMENMTWSRRKYTSSRKSALLGCLPQMQK